MSTFTRRFPAWLIAALLALVLAGCANRAINPASRNNLIFRIQMQGKVPDDPRVRIFFVVDASGQAGQGPKTFGPWLRDRPIIGADFPVYLGSDMASLSVPPGTLFKQALEPNSWTNAFVYTTAGGRRLEHWEQTYDPDTNARVVLPVIAARPPLIENQDWRVTSSRGTAPGVPQDVLELTIPFSLFGRDLTALNPAQVQANLVVQAAPPLEDTSIGATTERAGYKIDQWNLLDNGYFALSVSKASPVDRKDAPHVGALFPINVPSGVDVADCTLKGYTSEVRGL